MNSKSKPRLIQRHFSGRREQGVTFEEFLEQEAPPELNPVAEALGEAEEEFIRYYAEPLIRSYTSESPERSERRHRKRMRRILSHIKDPDGKKFIEMSALLKTPGELARMHEYGEFNVGIGDVMSTFFRIEERLRRMGLKSAGRRDLGRSA